MTGNMRGLLHAARTQGHFVGFAVVALFAVTMVLLTAGAALGMLPWLAVDASYGDTAIEGAGVLFQSALTFLAVTLAMFLPSAQRTMRLERSHRQFHVSMEDVTRAYRLSHEADRRGVFRAVSEFDSVRERLKHLRDHPDLGALEPEVLELAAQMSHTGRELAEVYSEAKVARAKTFLRQRQEEVDRQLETIAMAKKTVEDLKHWMMQIETEERVVERQITALEHDLFALLPQLGFDLDTEAEPVQTSVVPMRSRETVPHKEH